MHPCVITSDLGYIKFGPVTADLLTNRSRIGLVINLPCLFVNGPVGEIKHGR